jgi:NADH-quinone oxidoreductase subunit M
MEAVSSSLSLTTVTLFLPLVGLLILLFMREETEQQISAIKWTAFGFSIATFLLSIIMAITFDNSQTGLQMAQRNSWLPQLGISYYVGVDGLSMLLVLLTTIIMPIAIFSSFNAGVLKERGRNKLYFAFMLLLEWSMLGVFVVQDLIIFYIFWEVTLVPMYFLIGIWGAEDRVYAAVKFFLYTMAGSILMLLAILYVGSRAGTFAVPEIIAMVEQATAGSVILAGILLKMGTYGIIRFNLPMFPEATVEWAPVMATLGIIGIIYGAWVCYAQTDIKKLVAYSSVSHLGFVVLGIFSLTSAGIQGATIQMVNHGISTGGLFLMVGMLYERRHTKAMDAYGGIWKVMPLFGGISLVISLSSMGLPGLNGFVGEFTILLGALGSNVLGITFTAIATIGVILAAIYMLYAFQKVFMGPLDHEENRNLPQLTWQEVAVFVPILLLIFWIGIQPSAWFDVVDASATALVERMNDVIVQAGGNVVQILSAIP